MHNISNLFYFGTTLYLFRTVFPFYPQESETVLVYNSNKMHKSQSLFNLTTALHVSCKQPQNLYGMMLYVQS
jgi:hypothetical protein